MAGGVLRVTAPDGRVWWVKRGWVPRYRALRDRIGDYVEEHPRRWIEAPLRWYATGRTHRYALDGEPRVAGPWPDLAGDPLGQALAQALTPPGWTPYSVPHTSGAVPWLDVGGGSTIPHDVVGSLLSSPPLDVGGGSTIPHDSIGAALSGPTPDVGAALPHHALGSAAPSPSFDIGGGSTIPHDSVLAAAGTTAQLASAPPAPPVPSGGGAGGGGGGGGGRGHGVDPTAAAAASNEVVAILLVVAVVVGAVVLGWFVLLPLLLALIDLTTLLVAILFAGIVRLLLRRPWDVMAVEDSEDGVVVMRWELRGFRRAGHARDDIARALQTGTDADLAVARVLVREPRLDDPPGSARSVREAG